MAPATPGSRVSQLTLSVRISFKEAPYQIPEGPIGPSLLKAVVEAEARGGTAVEVLGATDAVVWVHLQPVYVRQGGEETMSNSDMEAGYRRACADAGKVPSQDGFLIYAAQQITGLQMGSF